MVTPFLAAGERITPKMARQFADRVRSDGGRVLYRVFPGKDSARVSAYNCARLGVFEGLGLTFSTKKVSTKKYGVFAEFVSDTTVRKAD